MLFCAFWTDVECTLERYITRINASTIYAMKNDLLPRNIKSVDLAF